MSKNYLPLKEPEVLNHPQSEMFIIQKSDLQLKLITFKDNVIAEVSSTQNIGDWLSFIGLILVMFTADFKSIIGISRENIKSLYIAIIIFSSFFFLRKIINIFKFVFRDKKDLSKSADPKKYTDEIKSGCTATMPINSKKPPKIKKR